MPPVFRTIFSKALDDLKFAIEGNKHDRREFDVSGRNRLSNGRATGMKVENV